MKKILALAISFGIVLTSMGTAQANSSPSFPTSVREVSPLGTWTGTASNPKYITFSDQVVDTLDKVSTVTTVTEISNVSSVDLVDKVTVVATVSETSVVKEVNNVTSVDLVDLVTKVNVVATVSETSLVKEVNNVTSVDLVDKVSTITSVSRIEEIAAGNNTIGKVKLTDNTTDVGVTTDGRLKVETADQAGTSINQYGQNTAVAANGTADLVNYQVSAGKTLYLNALNVSSDGASTFVVRWGTSTQTFDTAGVANTIATIKASAIVRSLPYPVYQSISVAATNRIFVRVTSEESVTQFASVNVLGKEK